MTATPSFLSVPHFMYHCRLAGDTVIKYLEVVLELVKYSV